MKRSLLLIVLALVSNVGAQVAATFTHHTNSGATQTNQHVPVVVPADLNNDGTQDLVICCNTSQGAYYQLSNRSGGFAAPHVLGPLRTLSTSGDFDRNGHTDVVGIGATGLTIFFNQGNGVFNQRSYPSLGLPLVAGDFNRDGNLDLLVSLNGGIYFAAGDGNGGFAAPVLVDSTPLDFFGQVLIADFDSDGNADMATISEACDQSHPCATQIRVLYGNGKGNFTAMNYNYGYGMQVVRDDVNHDGSSDLALEAYDPGQGQFVGALLGNANRTFTLKLSKVTLPTILDISPPGVADFNGDSRLDIADIYAGPVPTIGFFVDLAGTSSGTWTKQERFPAGSEDNTFFYNLLVADFNHDRKLDAVLLQYPSGALDVFLNTTSGGNFGGCTYPVAGQAIHVCSPLNGSSHSGSIRFTAAATFFSPIRKMELWVDGKKAAQQFRSWLDYSISLSSGTHKATIFAVGYDGDYEKSVVTFSVP